MSHGTATKSSSTINTTKHHMPNDMLSRIRILAMRLFDPRYTRALPGFVVWGPLGPFDATRPPYADRRADPTGTRKAVVFSR